VGATSELLTPLVEALRKHVLSATKIHADDTPVLVLAPGNGKTKTGRLWTYVRDERPAGEKTAPAVWFAYSPDRKGEHPRQHLKNFKGALQADAYAGFHHLYEGGAIYENEAGFPPAPAVIALARAMHVTADELLGIEPQTHEASKFEQVTSDPDSMRQWKRFQRIILLPERDQRAVIRLINSLTGIAAEAHD
jgi:hypothetical protein